MKKAVIFDLVGVLFSVNRYLVLKKLGIWQTMRFYLRYAQNPFDFTLSLLDLIRTTIPHEYQDMVHLKGVYLPKSMCLWQEGYLSTTQVCKKIMIDLDHVIRAKNIKKRDRRILEHLCMLIFDSLLQAKILKPIPKTIRIVSQLKQDKNNRVFLLTNIDQETFTHLIGQYPEVFALFNGIVTSYEAHLVKPDPAIYSLLLDRYDIDPHAAWYIDDQEDNLIAAQHFGIKTVLFSKNINLYKALHTLFN